MRFILSIPLLAIVLAAYNALNLSGGMMDTESLLFSWVLPSGSEAFFKLGDMFLIAGLVALFFEILKAARAGAGTIVDHMLSTATFIVALIEFLLVPFCGSDTFFMILVMTLIDVIGGFSVSLLATRRDYNVTHDQGVL